MTSSFGPGGSLRAAVDAIDAGILAAVADLGISGYRPRFSGIVRTIAVNGPSSIGELAHATGVTHSAASQTVTEMRTAGFVTLERGTDGRRRIVDLSPATRELLPRIESEWLATSAALRSLDEDLSVPLEQTASELAAALARRSFRERIADAITTAETPT
jgi:DNA-binding MarR family transcriptional regulator